MPKNQLRVIMTLGLPASGKSTWAKKFIKTAPGKWTRVNKDDIRKKMGASETRKVKESAVLNERDRLIVQALDKDINVVVDDTNINPIHEERIGKLIEGKAELEQKSFMDVPVATCIARNKLRTGMERVPDIAIRSMANQWKKRQLMKKAEAPIPVYDHQKPFCIIVDMDGTAAHVHKRSPYDTAKAYKDKPNLPVQKIVQWASKEVGHFKPIIIVVTGRDDKWEDLTKGWLEKHEIPYDALYMRKTGDRRPDTVVKKELYESVIKDKYNVMFVLEDRKKVCKMYREELGLTVLQVAEGDY